MGKRISLVWEFLRKAVHLSGLLIVLGYTFLLNYFTERVVILAMTGVLLLLLEFEYIRLAHRPRITALIDDIFRKHEKKNISGAVFLVISCIIAFSAFDYWIAVLAMFMTVFGDLFAAIIGRCFGKTVLYNGKTFVGTLAGFAANVAAGALILPHHLIIVLPMAFVGTVTELVTKKLDDNLTVPLFAGFFGQIIVYYFGLKLPEIDFTFLGLF